MPETTTGPKATKKNGAPLKNAPGHVPYHEVDRLLVFGELVDGPEGEPAAHSIRLHRRELAAVAVG